MGPTRVADPSEGKADRVRCRAVFETTSEDRLPRVDVSTGNAPPQNTLTVPERNRFSNSSRGCNRH